MVSCVEGGAPHAHTRGDNRPEVIVLTDEGTHTGHAGAGPAGGPGATPTSHARPVPHAIHDASGHPTAAATAVQLPQAAADAQAPKQKAAPKTASKGKKAAATPSAAKPPSLGQDVLQYLYMLMLK